MKNMSDKTLGRILHDCGYSIKKLSLEDCGEYENNKNIHYVNGEVTFERDYIICTVHPTPHTYEEVTIKLVEMYGEILRQLDEYDVNIGNIRTTIYLLDGNKYRIEKKNGYYVNAERI